METWTVQAIDPPAILRGCPRCGVKKRFLSSGLFRVNANGNRIDVWLIYRCETCDATLNLDVLTRVNPKSIPRELYDRYAANDAELAVETACDVALLRKNKAEPDYDAAHWELRRSGSREDGLLTITAPCALGLRLDKLLAEGLDISRTAVGKRFEAGEITGADAPVDPKAKVVGTIRLRLRELE